MYGGPCTQKEMVLQFEKLDELSFQQIIPQHFDKNFWNFLLETDDRNRFEDLFVLVYLRTPNWPIYPNHNVFFFFDQSFIKSQMRCIFSMQATKQMVEKKYTMQCAKPCGCKVASKETYFQYRYHNKPLNSAEFWDYSNSYYLRLLIWNSKNVHHIKVQTHN